MSFPQPARYGRPEIQTVIAWHDALNNGDVDRLVALSHPDVEVGGPRGSAHGAQTCATGWIARTFVWNLDGRSAKPTRWSWNKGRSGNPQSRAESRLWPPCSW